MILTSMEPSGVYLIGQSLIAETIADFIDENGTMARITRFPTLSQAISWIDEYPPRLIVLVDLDPELVCGRTHLIPLYPEIPFIILSAKDSSMNVVMTTELRVNTVEMMGVIQSLVRDV